jgi:hypothetical protein
VIKVGVAILIVILLASLIAAGKDTKANNERLRKEVVAVVGQLSTSMAEPAGEAAVSARQVLAEIGRFVMSMAHESRIIARHLWSQVP